MINPTPTRDIDIMGTENLAKLWSWYAEQPPAIDEKFLCGAGELVHAAKAALQSDLNVWEKLIVDATQDVIIQGEMSREIVSHLSFEGSRPPQLIDGQIMMSTESGTDDRSLLVFRTAPASHGAIYWFKVKIEDAVADQAQFRLIHSEGHEEEIIRIKPSMVTIGRSQDIHLSLLGQEHLIGVVVDGSFLHIYIDGMLCYRRARSRMDCPSGFLWDLNTCSTHSGNVSISAMGLATLSKPFAGFTSEDDRLPACVASAYVSEGLIPEFGKINYAVQDIDMRPQQGTLRQALKDMTESRYLSCPWITNPILSNLPVAEQAMEQKNIVDKLGIPMVKAENLAVRFVANAAKANSLFSLFKNLRDRKEMLQVFQDISFDLYSGDTLGIIGHNGAGKTTLLRAIAGVIALSKGRIDIRGQSILLRPGAGMREDLTGRQNILLGGIFMGLSMAQSKQIIEDVIEFSELRDAIDRPYRYYSDGMRSRLIFSIATALPPEILMLDELLGAGDLSFQEKANNRLSSYISKAKIVIVVEHGLSFVATKCNKVLYIGRGNRVFYGDPQIAVTQYMSERECENKIIPYGSPHYIKPQSHLDT